MEGEATEEQEHRLHVHVPVLRLVGALERARPLPAGGQPLLSRISRTALDHHNNRWAGSMPLNAERAMLLFTAASLNTGSRNARALAARGDPSCSVSYGGGDGPRRGNGNGDDPDRKMRLTSSHAIGSRTMMDTAMEGTSIQVSELRIRLTHTPPLPRIGDGRISLTAATDLHRRHRVAVESMISRDDKHSVSTIASSTDFSSAPAWGIATSHKFGTGLDLFSRYSSDRYAGSSVIVQAVKRQGRNTISPIVSVASKGRMQAGITWKSSMLCSQENDFFQLKALWNQKGVFSVYLRAQIGDPVQNS